MKKPILFKLLLVGLIFLLNCSGYEEEEIIEPELTIETISVADDEFLQTLIENNIGTIPNGRTMNSPYGNIDLESAVKVNNPELNVIRYSLLLTNENNPYGFDNYIIRERDGEISQYILSYQPDENWLLDNYANLNWSNYTGGLNAYLLDGTIITEDYLVNGVSTYSSSESGRVNECYECTFEVKESTATGNQYLEVSCEDGSEFVIFRIACGGESGGGSGGSGGGSGSGGSGGGSTGGSGGSTGGGGSSGGSGGGTGSGPGTAPDFGYEDDGTDPIGILPPFDLKEVLETQIDEEQDPNEKRRLQLIYISTHNSQDGRDFKSDIEELLASPGLTVGEVSDINIIVNEYYEDLIGRLIIANFYPVVDAAYPFIQLALWETGTGVLFQAVKGLLSIRWGIQLAKIGVNTASISTITNRMVNGLKFGINNNSLNLTVGGRNLMSSSVSSSKRAYSFSNVSSTEAKAIFNDMVAGRQVKRVEMGAGKVRETVVLENGQSITWRNFSRSDGLGKPTIEFKINNIRSSYRIELKF